MRLDLILLIRGESQWNPVSPHFIDKSDISMKSELQTDRLLLDNRFKIHAVPTNQAVD